MKDCKGIHEELLRREKDDWRDGWQSTGEHALYWMSWGVVLTLAVIWVLS